MKAFIDLIRENIKYRKNIVRLAVHDQKLRYRGSDMGLLWAFAKPMMYIFVFYFAISIGFKSSKDVSGIITPYFIWLTIGLISYFYMRDMILGGAACFRRYASYVANARYPVGTIPTSVATSFMIIHLVMVGIGLIITLLYGCRPSIYWLQLPFYMVLSFIFATFWSMATGIISAVFSDFYNLLQVLNQAVFWLSAILFDVNKLSPFAQKLFMFNPITYIVEGYRNAICRHVWFFEEPMKLGCYLLMMAVMMFVATQMYRKLRKRMPDVV